LHNSIASVVPKNGYFIHFNEVGYIMGFISVPSSLIPLSNSQDLHGTIICNKTDYKHEVLSANGTEYKDY
jgi:hypothetical protein